MCLVGSCQKDAEADLKRPLWLNLELLSINKRLSLLTDRGRGKEALLYRRVPAEQCRSNDKVRKLPFATPSVILDSGRDHQ